MRVKFKVFDTIMYGAIWKVKQIMHAFGLMFMKARFSILVFQSGKC